MYGQTEATARMAWLPPALAREHPSAIGIPVPGGQLRLETVPEVDSPGVGELVYTGPNVMMGYATTAADLARGGELSELRTGDLARVVDGLFEIVGRRGRVSKVFGLRLDLDRLEHALEQQGCPARCVVADERVQAFVEHGRRAGQVRGAIASFCSIPTSAVRVHVLPLPPRTPSGKVDQAALLVLAREAEAAATGALGRDDHDPVEQLRRQYALVLGRPDVTTAETFVSLGGDSLSYIELATRLEQLIPAGLPVGWHLRTIASLADQPPEPSAERPRGTTRPMLETTIALRGLAIVLIVASHVDLVPMEGGAHLLLILAGFNFARFQLGSDARTDRLRHGLAGLAQLVVPSVIWIGAVGVVASTYSPSTALLLNGLLGSDEWNDQWQFWFLEALVWTTAAALALIAVPAAHAAERRHPFGFPLALLVGTAVLRFVLVGGTAGPTERYTLGVVAFFFVLGWLAARATTDRRRVLVTLAALALVVNFFGQPGREAIILSGLALALWLPRLPCPRPLGRVAKTLAGASLFIYLTQWQVYPPLEDAGHPFLALLATLAVGIGYGLLMRPVQRAVGGYVRGHRRSSRVSATGTADSRALRGR